MAADRLADHMEAVPDTEWGIQNSPDVVVHSQAAEDSRDSPGIHQLSVVADNSCKGCNLLALVEQLDMACWSALLDKVLTDLHCAHTHTQTHITRQTTKLNQH